MHWPKRSLITRRVRVYFVFILSALVLALATILTTAASAILLVLSVVPRALGNVELFMGGPSVYYFDMLSANTATSDGSGVYPAGYVMRMTGSGSFDLEARRISGEGSYKILDKRGRIVDRGIWTPNSLINFERYGGPARWIQGGSLVFDANMVSSLTGRSSATVTTVTCLAGDPPVDVEEGITSTGFPQATSGEVVFQIE